MRKVKIVLGLGIVLGVVGGTFLAAFGVLYVKPYMEIRTMEQGTCVTSYNTVGDKNVPCTCADHGSSQCVSHYPCVHLVVNLTTKEGATHSNVTLYDSHETFVLQYKTYQCSYHKCAVDNAKNLEVVETFRQDYGMPGTTFDCHYEPSNLTYSILHVVTRTTIIHTLLWPALALLTGFIILLVYLNDPSQAQHHFNSLERPWLRQQAKYECIINPGEANAAAITSPTGTAHAQGASTSASTTNLASPSSSATPVAQLI